MPFTFTFSPSQNQTFELRCDYGTRRLDIHELANLINQCEENYYSQEDDDIGLLREIGCKLYSWLDGKEGWLRRALSESTDRRIYLDLIKTSEAQGLNPETKPVALGLAHLPWELLHNDTEFLLYILPVRKVKQENSSILGEQNRPLRLLFMATSPEHPGIALLQFEKEETNILQATKDRRNDLNLVVEESGSVAELGNLVNSYAENYFDVFHLMGHGVIYTKAAYSGYLPPGKQIADYTPCFITEDELGDMVFTTVDDLAKAFKNRFPRVVFLSGCHTGQIANQGTVPSMAEALVKAGAAVVLGWARPVFDSTGIIAAQTLYQALATGETVEAAVKAAQMEMIAQKCSDWHLLRIYRDTRLIEKLVTPLNTKKREKLKFNPPENEFLDENNIIKVASRVEFVGRRRALQRGLKALRQTSDEIGVFIAGMGGLGKSSLAARLCTRVQSQRDNFQRVVLIGPVDEIKLIGKLASKYERFAGVPALLNDPNVPSLKGRLQNFFEHIEDELDQPLLLVLDDFEQNIPESNIADGSLRMTTDAYRVLEAVCAALAENQAESRLIVTCRYLQPETLPPHRLHLETLAGMGETDIEKIYRGWDRQIQLQARTQRISKIASGNPRLLKWLVEVLQQPGLAADELLTKLENTELKFRENILAETLLSGLKEEEKKFLARLSVFHLPVQGKIIENLSPNLSPARREALNSPPSLDVGNFSPNLSPTRREALNSPPSLVGKGVGGLGLLPKLISLSLVESATVYAGQNVEYRVTTILAPLLQPLLTEAEWQTTHQAATRTIYQTWWEESDNCNLRQGLEIVRLAVRAQEQEIAVTVGNAIATRWVNRSRVREAWELCQEILQLGEDYRILETIARAEVILALLELALSHFQQALKLCPEDDLKVKASILHNVAILKATQGDIVGAWALFQQSRDIKESINDVQGEAATLHEMANLKATQGDIAGAFPLFQQSLEITDSINDVKTKAATLRQMANLQARQRDIAGAFPLFQQCLKIHESINDVQGKAATLASMAYWEGQRGNKTEQLELNLQAAQLFAQVRAYLDLRRVLTNLGLSAETNGIIYLAQAVWLCLRIEVPLHDTVNTLVAMYYKLPQGDEMQGLLGETAVFFCRLRGDGHPQLEELKDRSLKLLKLLSGAAAAQGIENPEAIDVWFAEKQLSDPQDFRPRLNQQLEAIIGDGWLFNPGVN
ncbi:CHAT domain-containing protein [Cylindrospermum sp. FACHB-282]|uniref:CHAT domain-containing protein n=1 Tax=Cylindrospermum sp. FACHB-282 TaxID=2692794 RepID=UPI0016862148|nr:CHAT domain-containing protein [Cylindrospermum sp. FACHB-282]MBD2386384.1 CHAT domain-containing protein [Cylindrospermum sp. FACHB-282]